MDRTDDYAQYLDDYQTLRTQVRDLNSQLLDLLSRKTLKQARRRLDLHRLPLDEAEADVARTVLVDYAIHFARRGGRRLQEVYFDEHSPEPGSLLDVYRRHLNTYHYTILRIQDTEPGVGIEVADLLQDEETFFLMDRNFSQTVDVGAAINTGILHLPDFALTTGAALPLPQTAGKHLAAKIPEQIGAPREVDFATLPPPQMAKLAALIIRTALHEGAASKVGYR